MPANAKTKAGLRRRLPDRWRSRRRRLTIRRPKLDLSIGAKEASVQLGGPNLTFSLIARAALAVAVVGSLAACGGGGGGGGPMTTVSTPPPTTTPTPPAPPAVNFVSWSQMETPSKTTVVAVRVIQSDYVLSGTGGLRITPTAAADATYSETRGVSGGLTAAKFTSPGKTFDFTSAAGDQLTSRTEGGRYQVRAYSADGAQGLASSINAGLSYLAFGAWGVDKFPVFAAASGSFGTFLIGGTTAGSAIPTSGSATFNGTVLATYADQAGALQGTYGAQSLGSLNVDFAGRSASFATDEFYPAQTLLRIPGTVVRGNLTYASGQNMMTGRADTYDSGSATPNGRLSGEITAQFYGPAAEEVGALFALVPATGSTSNERLIARFGGKR